MPASESLNMGCAVPVLLAHCFFCCRYTSGCTSRDLPQSRAISRQALYLARAVRRACTHSTLGVTLILDALELGGRCDKSPRLIAEIAAFILDALELGGRCDESPRLIAEINATTRRA